METSNLLDDKKKQYLESMSEKELKAYYIAKDHLGDSFQLEKSLGFLKWFKKFLEDSANCK